MKNSFLSQEKAVTKHHFSQNKVYPASQLATYFINRHPDEFTNLDVDKMLYYTKVYFLVTQQRVIFPETLSWLGYAIGIADFDFLSNWAGSKISQQDTLLLTSNQIGSPACYQEPTTFIPLPTKTARNTGEFHFYLVKRNDLVYLKQDQPFLNQIADNFSEPLKMKAIQDYWLHSDPIVQKAFKDTMAGTGSITFSNQELYDAFSSIEQKKILEDLLGIDIDMATPIGKQDAPESSH